MIVILFEMAVMRERGVVESVRAWRMQGTLAAAAAAVNKT
jgi:hypothetical protein